MSKTLTLYIALICVCGLGLFGVLKSGTHLMPSPATTGVGHTVVPTKAAHEQGGIQGNLQQPLSRLLLQLVVVLAATKAVGGLFRRWKQPTVIGEMLAGILLGPSLIGWIFPDFLRAVFPPASLGTLSMLSQLGIILYMFVIGSEIELDHLRQRAQTALLISHASIVIPFLLGATLALFLYRPLIPAGTPFPSFALFMGISMSITAFPVLARILEERGLKSTVLGNTAIACAAIDDVTAWCLLALVVTIAKATSLESVLLTVLLALLFVLFLFGVVKPRLASLLKIQEGEPLNEQRVVGGCLLLLLVSAWCTQVIGIYVLFGSFLAGAILPRDPRITILIRERLGVLSANLLLPLFFAFTGLRTQIGLLGDARGWGYALAIIGVAIAGKLGGSYLAARWSGMSRSESFALGSLMNTRGLVELIVLNIGYDLGVLSPSVFAMLVLMALATTLMTSPLLSLNERRKSTYSKD